MNIPTPDISSLGADIRTQNLRTIDALSFANSPIDFGAVFTNASSYKSIAIKVNASTNLSLTIKGDTCFQAVLVASAGGSGTGTAVTGGDQSKQIPILVNQYVPKGDIVTGGINVAAITRGALVKAAPQLQATKTFSTNGVQVEFLAPHSAPQVPAAAAGVNRSRTWKPGDTHVNFNDFVQNNIDATSGLNYSVNVTFNAPATALQQYSAVLTLAFDSQSVDIPLSAQTGDAALTLIEDGASVVLGSNGTVNYSVVNSSFVPIQILIPAALPIGGFSVDDQNFTIAANSTATISLLLKTTTAQNYNGPTPFNIHWLAKLNNSVSVKRTIASHINCVSKAPVVTLPASVIATQGKTCTFLADIQNLGASTTFVFTASNLPAGVTMSTNNVFVLNSQHISTAFVLNIAAHTPITVGNTPKFTIKYSAYNGKVTGSADIAIKIKNSFIIQAQQMSNWCWIAVSASCFDYYGGLVAQCSLIQALQNFAVDPCKVPPPDDCNQPGHVNLALSHLGIFNGAADNAFNLAQVCNEIDAGKPIVVGIRWPDADVGHVVVISGYVQNTDNTILLIVDDPANGSSIKLIDIDTLTSSYQGIGIWKTTFLTQPPPAQVQSNNSVNLN